MMDLRYDVRHDSYDQCQSRRNSRPKPLFRIRRATESAEPTQSQKWSNLILLIEPVNILIADQQASCGATMAI